MNSWRQSPRRARIIGALQTLGIIGVMLGVASIPVTVVVSTWLARRAMWAEWTASGPACPVVTQISIAGRGAKPPRPFVYQGVGFARQIGDADCVAVPQGVFQSRTFPVCAFDAPAAIEVTAGGRTTIFEPGVGHSATVMVRDGQPSCVVGAPFSL